MNRIHLKMVSCLFLIVALGLFEIRCAAMEGLKKNASKNDVHPLTQINLDKIYAENRGLKVIEENATALHDYYRGAVQEKEEGEGLLKEGKWEEARSHLERSNRFLHVVLKVLPKDEAHWNIYGDQVVIFLPNLLIADNDLKLNTVYRALGSDEKARGAKNDGEYYLAQSLKDVKTEWGVHIKKGLENALSEK